MGGNNKQDEKKEDMEEEEGIETLRRGKKSQSNRKK